MFRCRFYFIYSSNVKLNIFRLPNSFAFSFGINPILAIASHAWASISYHILNFVLGDHISTIWGASNVVSFANPLDLVSKSDVLGYFKNGKGRAPVFCIKLTDYPSKLDQMDILLNFHTHFL